MCLVINISTFFIDYGDERKKAKDEKKEEGVGKSQEEKRKHIKTLIDKIPTDKNALFAFQLDWAAVDNVSMILHVPRVTKNTMFYYITPIWGFKMIYSCRI